MPKNLFQTVIFTIMMVIVMVYAMICYNMALGMGAMDSSIFAKAFGEMIIMCPIAFILDFFVVSKIAFYKAAKLVNIGEEHPFHMVIAISFVSVICMCPLMSFAATILFKQDMVSAHGLIATWLQTTALNFPVAMAWQFCYAGPFVRFVFGLIFREKEVASDAIPEAE
ncbi:MAG: DUF2798 domain-containing protein [Lachnospiraceae bacterium]|nr:DUF2798 domain-containing protein [Lachnospiraceae bacterium]